MEGGEYVYEYEPESRFKSQSHYSSIMEQKVLSVKWLRQRVYKSVAKPA